MSEKKNSAILCKKCTKSDNQKPLFCVLFLTKPQNVDTFTMKNKNKPSGATVNTRRCQLVCQKSQHKHCQDNSQLTVCLPTVKSTSQHLLVRHLLWVHSWMCAMNDTHVFLNNSTKRLFRVFTSFFVSEENLFRLPMNAY